MKFLNIFLLFLLLIFHNTESKAQETSEESGTNGKTNIFTKRKEVNLKTPEKILRLPGDYNRREHQPGGTEVVVMIGLESISEISENDRTVEVMMDIYLGWEDSRIEFLNETLFDCLTQFSVSPDILESLWTPDPVFLFQRSVEERRSSIKEDFDSKFMIRKSCSKYDKRIKLIFEQAIMVKVNCPEMEFSDFPLDTQSCGFFLRVMRQTENVTMIAPRMLWNALTSSDYNITVDTESGTFYGMSLSGFHVGLQRKTTVYIYTYFLPCSLMVLVSWVSFAVPTESVPGRLGLLLTLLLMLINLTTSATKSIPSSESICPLIIWIWLSLGFVAFALCEYFVILAILRFTSKSKVTFCVGSF